MDVIFFSHLQIFSRLDIGSGCECTQGDQLHAPNDDKDIRFLQDFAMCDARGPLFSLGVLFHQEGAHLLILTCAWYPLASTLCAASEDDSDP